MESGGVFELCKDGRDPGATSLGTSTLDPPGSDLEQNPGSSSCPEGIRGSSVSRRCKKRGRSANYLLGLSRHGFSLVALVAHGKRAKDLLESWRETQKKGIPDIVVIDWKAIFELKFGDNTLTDEQKVMIRKFEARGWRAYVPRSLEDFLSGVAELSGSSVFEIEKTYHLRKL